MTCVSQQLRQRDVTLVFVASVTVVPVEKSKVKGEYMARAVPNRVQDYADRVRAMYHVYEKSSPAVKSKKQ